MNSPKFSEWSGRKTIWKLGEPFGISLGHVETTVGSKVEPMESVLKISQISEDADIFVGQVITISITNAGKVGSVGNPQPVALPGQALNGIESRRELMALLGLPVGVFVRDNPNRVGPGVGLWGAILGAHANVESSFGIESDGAGISDDGIAGEERDLKVLGGDGKIVLSQKRGCVVGPQEEQEKN